MKKLLLAAAFAMFSVSAFAASNPAPAQPAVAAVPSSTTSSAHLDVAKVLSISPSKNDCNIGVKHMEYLDSSGAQHSLNYDVVDTGSGCNS